MNYKLFMTVKLLIIFEQTILLDRLLMQEAYDGAKKD